MKNATILLAFGAATLGGEWGNDALTRGSGQCGGGATFAGPGLHRLPARRATIWQFTRLCGEMRPAARWLSGIGDRWKLFRGYWGEVLTTAAENCRDSRSRYRRVRCVTYVSRARVAPLPGVRPRPVRRPARGDKILGPARSAARPFIGAMWSFTPGTGWSGTADGRSSPYRPDGSLRAVPRPAGRAREGVAVLRRVAARLRPLTQTAFAGHCVDRKCADLRLRRRGQAGRRLKAAETARPGLHRSHQVGSPARD